MIGAGFRGKRHYRLRRYMDIPVPRNHEADGGWTALPDGIRHNSGWQLETGARMKGYVYVLVNSSLPGLVKVGKTTRLPSERVQELSGATGVPTPFIVAFEEAFDDCNVAEQFVHAQLESKGLRQASNREFFRANTADVIRVVLNAPRGNSAHQLPQPNVDRERDELDDMVLETPHDAWADLLSEGIDHYYGLNGHLEDPVEARRLFMVAAKLGSGEAWNYLGRISQYGESVREDPTQALEYYKNAVRFKYPAAYGAMAVIFCLQDHQDNSIKCSERLVDAWKRGEIIAEEYDRALYGVMRAAAMTSQPYPVQTALNARAPQLIELFRLQMAHQESHPNPDAEISKRMKDKNIRAIAWLES